jgi:3-oxoacyl-[acyl-carrier-protein] synthase II
VLSIAVTGLGAVASNGRTAGEMWEACLAGRSGVVRLDAGLPMDIGAPVALDDVLRFVSRRDARLFDASEVVATAAATMALEDVGAHGYAPERVGACIGSGVGPSAAHANAARALDRGGAIAVSAHFPAAGAPSLAASLPAMALGLRGPVLGASGACATAAFDIVSAAHLLGAGDADLVLAGAVDISLEPHIMAGFANMRALARHDDPARACRPLDRARNGLVLADGAAVLALERLDDARRRGARVRAVLRGYGLTSDAGAILAADRDGIARAVRLALARAEIGPDSIDHVNLHAAGTLQGDLAEAQGLRDALGPRACAVPATAPKSLLGHALGAASGLEAVVLVRTLETGIVPPTRNLDDPDPELGLDARAEAREARVRFALKTASGLGGLNAALVFEAATP